MALTDTHSSTIPSFTRLLRGVFGPVGRFFVAVTESNTRIRRVEALNRLSDAELAARGLRREDIVRHVFGDTFYI